VTIDFRRGLDAAAILAAIREVAQRVEAELSGDQAAA
jgi:hypothetical protein